MVGFKGQTQRHSSLCQTKITDYSGKESGLCNFVFICLLQKNFIQDLSVCLALILISVHFACTAVGSTFIILQ